MKPTTALRDDVNRVYARKFGPADQITRSILQSVIAKSETGYPTRNGTRTVDQGQSTLAYQDRMAFAQSLTGQLLRPRVTNYQLYLPSKEELQRNLLQWAREAGGE